MGASGTLGGVYDYRLVALSVFIAIIAAYAALDLAGRITTAHGKTRLAWLSGGAIAMGTGIWAMHYVGMEALTLSVPILYDWRVVVVSLLAAVVASGIALFIVSRPTMGVAATIIGSIFMGCGIASMHYIGMEAMRFPGMCEYSPSLVTLSVVLAIGISYIALQLKFVFRSQVASWSLNKFGSAVLMGMAIPIMHYVGMAAVKMVPGGNMGDDLSHAVNVSSLGLLSIVLVTLLILGLVIITSLVDRRLSKQAQQIAESRHQLQTIFDHMTDGIVVLDVQKNLRQSNQAAIELLGLSGSHVSNETFPKNFEILYPNGQILSPEDWPINLALGGKFLQHHELVIRRKDTDQIFVTEVSTTPIKNRAGETTQIIVTCRDISESKLNMDARARLTAIVDSSEDAIIGKDDKNMITSWNAAAERIFGYTAEEMIGQSLLRLVPADREQEEVGFLNRVNAGELIGHVETLRRTKNGKLIHVSLNIYPIRDAKGEVIGSSTMARDITAQKQLERQLQQSQKMEAIGQLTGGIAHDFNNLLGVIVGNLTLIERAVGADVSTAKRLQTAQKAAARGADLTRRLLAFSSNEELNPTPTILGNSIRNTIELATRALGPEIRITTKLDETMPPIFVDPTGLESALLNLAVNARDAMPRGGSLTITSEVVDLEENYPPVKTGEMKAGLYASVSVTDTGSGMSPETMARALEPFFTTKPRGKGTGLGLAMVYGFVKQSGGTIRLYSEMGYGTTVTFYLQFAQEVKKAPEAAFKTHSTDVVGGKVLVVDDENDLLDIAFAYLEQTGYTPLRAKDGASALQMIECESDIDLVITDVIMPGGMNGVELVEKIRSRIPGIKVIYSSGFPADALAERSGTVVDGLLLRKPYQRAEFDEIVCRTLTTNDSGSHRVTH